MLGVDHFTGASSGTAFQIMTAAGLDVAITQSMTIGLGVDQRLLRNGAGSPQWTELGLRVGARW